MSDKKQPLAVLWDAEMSAVKHLPLDVIPQFIKRGDDRLESAASVMRQKSLDVFKKKSARAFGTQNPREFKEKRSADVSKAKAPSRRQRKLDRESRRQGGQSLEASRRRFA